VQFEDRPIPSLSPSNPHDVLVQIKQTGICGSDVHYYSHGAIGSFIVRSPMVLGHESSGIVTAIGPAVTTLSIGDRVALEPGVPCRSCSYCKEGRYNLCPEMAFAATPPFDGTLCKYWRLPEDFCYKLPEHVSLEEGALVEPLSVAVHVSRQAGIKFGQSVVVFGAGPIGLLCCAVAKAFGASKIVVVDIVESRLRLAKTYGATTTYVPEKISAAENAERIVEAAGLGEGADVVIDASGAEPSVQTGIHVIKSGGTYVQGGMGRPEIAFPISAMTIKEINVKGSFRYSSGDYATAVELIASGRVNVKELITGRVKFRDSEQVFKDVLSGKEGLVKVIISGVED
jgi:D-xylulose reductase